MNNWKELLDSKVCQFCAANEVHEVSQCSANSVNWIKAFIETEIVEELIKDIQDSGCGEEDCPCYPNLTEIKAKWLGKDSND
jgi:hypothetical protein